MFLFLTSLGSRKRDIEERKKETNVSQKSIGKKL